MVFKKLLGALGVGGPSIETILRDSNVRPGGIVSGDIHLIGGEREADILGINVALVTRVEVESGDSEYSQNEKYAKAHLSGRFQLQPGVRHSFPFQLEVPWETPLTHMYGQPLRGTTVGVATELEVARAVDATDLDPIAVHPLPAQERVLAAFSNLGFQFRNADCEKGRIYGVNQLLPFYQEIEFYPGARYSGSFKQLEVTFVSNPASTEVVLELDKRTVFGEGHDTFLRFTVPNQGFENTDWEQHLDGLLQQAGRKRGWF
ncbi:sporulation-control protein [Actinocorallia herbida]|uniref:Sporulation-control protein n=1 Tax=Actinocorallia herbida TaxID=58109 RepID=A0A3N1DAB8_9ACTN|nr:sporulation protein [Actinocorallia herbida]ROO90473.1 sporulation-control protein [Actinocorallia herbida]